MDSGFDVKKTRKESRGIYWFWSEAAAFCPNCNQNKAATNYYFPVVYYSTIRFKITYYVRSAGSGAEIMGGP